jgi:hypothetical protein
MTRNSSSRQATFAWAVLAATALPFAAAAQANDRPDMTVGRGPPGETIFNPTLKCVFRADIKIRCADDEAVPAGCVCVE